MFSALICCVFENSHSDAIPYKPQLDIISPIPTRTKLCLHSWHFLHSLPLSSVCNVIIVLTYVFVGVVVVLG